MPYRSREQQNEYQRKWAAQRRADWFQDKACVKCGSSENLELDHIDGKTKVSHKIWSWSAARRDIEVAKCQVLCYSCHREKTTKELTLTTHGNSAQWCKGCRCQLCRDDHARRAREYRAGR